MCSCTLCSRQFEMSLVVWLTGHAETGSWEGKEFRLLQPLLYCCDVEELWFMRSIYFSDVHKHKRKLIIRFEMLFIKAVMLLADTFV